LSRKVKAAPRVDSMSSQREMSFDNLPTINRFVLVIEPTDVFLERARKYPDEDPTLTLDELLEDTSAYLMPQIDLDSDSWLAQNFKRIFEIELNDWSVDPTCWPKDRSFKAFKKFFSVRFCSIVIDMGEGPINREYT
jgi:hypothetical protein